MRHRSHVFSIFVSIDNEREAEQEGIEFIEAGGNILRRRLMQRKSLQSFAFSRFAPIFFIEEGSCSYGTA